MPARPTHVIKTPFGSSSELPLQTFLDDVLPPLRHGLDLQKVLEFLQSGQRYNNIITKQGRWRGFAKDPRHSESSVHHTFKHLESVVKSIINACNQVTAVDKPTLHFKSNPTLVAKHVYSPEETFPHASFLEGPELSWDKIAVCGEYRKEEDSESVQDAIANVTDNMVNCFQHDPRRRFVFGFGINNTEMRFWFCDRSRFLVSEPFNFLTEHIPWIRFCLSTIYAEPHQLGWDTTMIPLPDGHNFDILVRSAEGQTRTYRTQIMLSGKTARNRLGKDTKVWRAVRIEDGKETGSPVALKDCWVHPDYAREGDLIRDIYQDVLKTEDNELVARNFMNLECHGDVFIGDDEPVLDCTRTFPTDGPAHDSTSEIFKRRLVHYRLTLSPAGGRSVEHETSVQTIYRTLAHVAGSLRLMHESGWVHRDVSTGNILVGDGPCLVDFEYAKRASEENDFNIGTRFFKAFELDREMYHYTPPPELTPGPTPSAEELRERMKALKERLRLFRARGPPNPQQQQRQTMANTNPQDAQANTSPARAEVTLPTLIPLRYNPLHDLESLWWVGVYFLLKREIYHVVPLGGEDSDHWDREKQRKCADEVFYSTDARSSIMMHDSGYFYRYVVPVVHPNMRPVAEILQDLRRALLQRYVDVEKDAASVDFTCAEGLYEQFTAGFSEIEDHPQLKDVLLVALVSPPDLGAPYNVIRPPLNVPKPESEAIPDQGAQTAKKERKKGSKATRPRKPATHQYNLRPRTKRS